MTNIININTSNKIKFDMPNFKEMSNSVSQLHPVSSDISNFREINTHIRNKQFDEAENLAIKWRTKEFDNSEAWRVSAMFYSATNQSEKALTCIDFAKMYEKESEFRNSFSEAKIHLNNENYEKVSDIYNGMLKKFNKPETKFIAASVMVDMVELSMKYNRDSTPIYLEMINSFIKNDHEILSDFYSSKLAKLQAHFENGVTNKQKP